MLPRATRAGGLALLGAALLAAGCSREPSPSRLVVPAGGAATPAVDPALRWVTAAAVLRRAPSEASHVPVPGERRPVANAVRTLQRGEQVRVVAARDGWTQVRDAGDQEGWVKDGVLLAADVPSAATVLVEAWAFDRPDLLATNARRRISPGTLLFVRKTGDLFTEVDAGPGPSTWVLSDRIASGPDDVKASLLVERARQLSRAGKGPEALAVLASLRAEQPGSPLVPVLSAELGEPVTSPADPPRPP